MMREIFVSTLCAIFASNLIATGMLYMLETRQKARTKKMFDEFHEQNERMRRAMICEQCGARAIVPGPQVYDATGFPGITS